MAGFSMGKNLVNDLTAQERLEGRTGADTIRLWENFKEQAYLWRAIAILQMPATFLALLGWLIVFMTADITIEPPENPQPGRYSVKQMPDSEFLRAATDIVNLIATYQPMTAEAQFRKARTKLWEPALSEFEARMIGINERDTNSEIWAISSSHRSQVFLVNNDLVRVQRFPNKDIAVVRLPGTVQRIISNEPLKSEEIVYYVKMTTIPRSAYNESGIVVIDIRLKKQTAEDLKILDNRDALLRPIYDR